MKITIKQIADEAKVSTATVSRVIHSPHLVKEDKRKKIQNIINKYKYEISQPIDFNQKYIGLIFPELDNVFFSKIIDEFIAMCEINYPDYDVICYYSCDNPEREYKGLCFLQSKGCDVIIIIPSSKPILYPKSWNESPTPIIWVERAWSTITPTYAVLSNKELAAYEATNTLLRHNTKSILLINGPKDLTTVQARTLGMQKSIREHNLDLSKQHISYGDFTWNHGYLTIKNTDISNYDAIISSNNSIAQGALQALYEKNVLIPSDIAFITFDEASIFHFSNISSIYFSGKDMADAINNILQGLLSNNLTPYTYYMNASKILRGSEIKN